MLKINEGLALTIILLAIALVPLPQLASDSVPNHDEPAAAEPPPPMDEPTIIDEVRIPANPAYWLDAEPPPSIEDVQRSISTRKPEEPILEDPDPEPETTEEDSADGAAGPSTDEEPVLKAPTVETSSPRRPPMYHSSLASALSEADGRPILCYFTWESGCPPCARISANVFPQPEVQAALSDFESARIVVDQSGNSPNSAETTLFRSGESGAQRRRIAVPYCAVYDPASGGVATFNPGGYVDDPGGFVAELRRARERAAQTSSPWFKME